MKSYRWGLVMLAMVLMATAGPPVRRSTALEARRRSAVDRNLVRLGRSYPAEPSAAEIREAFQNPARRGNSFLRLGRSQPVTLTDEDLITLLRAYDDDQDTEKQTSNFVRFGRDPKFIRFGRSGTEEKNNVMLNVPQRQGRARDHFVRLGRDVEDMGPESEDTYGERKKRSTI